MNDNLLKIFSFNYDGLAGKDNLKVKVKADKQYTDKEIQTEFSKIFAQIPLAVTVKQTKARFIWTSL